MSFGTILCRRHTGGRGWAPRNQGQKGPLSCYPRDHISAAERAAASIGWPRPQAREAPSIPPTCNARIEQGNRGKGCLQTLLSGRIVSTNIARAVPNRNEDGPKAPVLHFPPA